jgi:CheY-like chemotaxis protein
MTPQQSFLLIEDDDVDAMTVQRAFRTLNLPNPLHRVTDGEQGLAFLRDPGKPRPGVILLDLNMPRMNGTEFLGAVKADPDLKLIPVIVLTTSVTEADRLDCFSRCVAGYMVKPVNHEQFVQTLRVIRDYWALSELTRP